uniref:Uncharacterized protein n=1 Tax=Candidatus Kentrum eta TaxID=2126337 RepID=A0A450ULS3_9GAMM|nr:MAG: protein of unknown function (DUF945) [Candidatus Kentron sp. H]VFJ94301.1 MAG: protein of unknown function (DUF945) [Candidatus Kentron sp. H]VFK00916.1 MAG: protein of unknown function (DUF945) [Candidatus Kentron sp. H]
MWKKSSSAYKDLKLAQAIDGSDERLANTLDISLDGLTLAGDHYGPGRFVMALRDLDAEAFARFQQAMEELGKQEIPEDQLSLLMSAKLVELAPDFLRAGPKLEIPRLAFKTPNGEISGTLTFNLSPQARLSLEDPVRLLRGARGNASLRIPRALLLKIALVHARETLSPLLEELAATSPEEKENILNQRAELGLEGLVQQGIIMPDGEDYRVSAAFWKGELEVNENVVWRVE